MLGENHPMTDCNFKLFLRRIYSITFTTGDILVQLCAVVFAAVILVRMLWEKVLKMKKQKG